MLQRREQRGLCVFLQYRMSYTASTELHFCLDVSTNMDRCKLWFVVLLMLAFYIDSTETLVKLVKTIGSKPYIAPICPNETLHIVILVVCKIRTEMRGEECRLLYQHGQDFEQDCDSRFTLTTDNRTLFLQLTGLIAKDSGNFTCECSHARGTDTLHLILTVLHLKITVKEDEDASSLRQMPIHSVLIGVTIVIIITGVILGIIYRTKTNRNCSRSATSGLSVCETPGSLDQDDTDDLYTSLQQPESDLYQTISNPASKLVTVPIDNQEIIRGETDSSCVLTETVAADGCWP
ncbi:uncharacterized protein LOC127378407 isoform X1 [Dicentrarchus labrax]|uniref:uncharacterized protein LOC127378407 isoform X1 n=1 Tax=Dicentrarchus labrax TaxID=13489 RepID=UPI0021F5D17A|nr:uncharacterized protein LOC127378407 isoform X1 [Dicentrarchus labrax]